MAADIGVVVVTYSPGDTLAAFLDSLAAATDRPVEVVIADNGSTDGAPERAAQREGVRLLRTGSNLGYGRAANLGVAEVATDWVVIANPDIVWTAGALDQLIDATSRWPQAVAFGPRILTGDQITYPSARDLPSLGRGIGHAVFGWWWSSNPWTRHYRREREALVERPAGWLSGSCMVVRRWAWEQIGGFDPAYFMYFEDVDLGQRLGQLGANVYIPSAVVIHEGGHATGRDPRRMARAHHDSAWLYLQRRYPAAWQAPLRAVLHAGLYARAVLAGRVPAVAAGARLAGSSDRTDTREPSSEPSSEPSPTRSRRK